MADTSWYKQMAEDLAPMLKEINEIARKQREDYYAPYIQKLREKTEQQIAKSGMTNSSYAANVRNNTEQQITSLLAGQPGSSGLESQMFNLFGQMELNKQANLFGKMNDMRSQQWYKTKLQLDAAQNQRANNAGTNAAKLAGGFQGAKGIPLGSTGATFGNTSSGPYTYGFNAAPSGSTVPAQVRQDMFGSNVSYYPEGVEIEVPSGPYADSPFGRNPY